MNKQLWMTPKEYAKQMGIDLSTVQRWLSKGVIEGAIQPGGQRGRWWIPREGADSNGNNS